MEAVGRRERALAFNEVLLLLARHPTYTAAEIAGLVRLVATYGDGPSSPAVMPRDLDLGGELEITIEEM